MIISLDWLESPLATQRFISTYFGTQFPLGSGYWMLVARVQWEILWDRYRKCNDSHDYIIFTRCQTRQCCLFCNAFRILHYCTTLTKGHETCVNKFWCTITKGIHKQLEISNDWQIPNKTKPIINVPPPPIPPSPPSPPPPPPPHTHTHTHTHTKQIYLWWENYIYIYIEWFKEIITPSVKLRWCFVNNNTKSVLKHGKWRWQM